jgi:hypothetical protein
VAEVVASISPLFASGELLLSLTLRRTRLSLKRPTINDGLSVFVDFPPH